MANLADHLFRQARERGDKVALVFGEQSWTFAEMADRVRAVAGGLAAEGVATGAHVGLLVTARPEFIFLQQALFALGATVSPLNTFYKESEILHVVESCDLDHLVIAAEFIDRMPPAGEAGTETLRNIIVIDPFDAGADARLVAHADGAPIAGPVDLADDAIGLMLNTSATTGKAKGVMLSLANIRENYDRSPGWLGLDSDTVTLCALPLYNTFGQNQCINALMVTGATLVLLPRFDAMQCIEAIERHHCTFFPAVPTMLQKVIDHPEAPQHDITHIKRIMTGGAPVPAALLERIYGTMGADTVIITGYGLTEGTALATTEEIVLDAEGKVRRPKSIGKPVSHVELRLVTEDGRTAGPGEVGEICLRGPNVMQGYYKRPEDTAAAIVDGWLHTGDLGIVDDEGYYYIVDRKKDLIIRGGQNIYPADIEEILYQSPAVAEAAVIGLPDDLLGEVPFAYVALKPGASATSEELIARCKQELAQYKVPKGIEFLPELPKGPTGKILKRALRPN